MAKAKWRSLVATVVVIALLGGFIAFGVDRNRNQPSPTTQPISAVQATFTPVTGIRAQAPTVISGVIVNTSTQSESLTLTIDDLPNGLSLTDVYPSQSTPENGAYWSCQNSTCRLINSAGQPVPLAANDSAQIMFAFQGNSSLPIDSSVTFSINDRPPSTVSLSLPNGQAPLADNALTTSLTGPALFLNGTQATYELSITNLSPQAATSPQLAINAQNFANTSFTSAGQNWNCSGLQCAYNGTLAPFSVSTPLQVTATSTAGSQTATASISTSASAIVNGSTLSASSSLSVTQRQSDSRSVSTRLSFSPASLVAPGSTNAQVAITPTGNAATTQNVSFQLNLPKGITANWDSFQTSDTWSCSNNSESCTSTAPLPSGVVSLIEIPLSITDAAHHGTNNIEVVSSVPYGDGINKKTVSAGLVINPPPVPEFRASLLAAANDNFDGITVGQSLQFSPGQPRQLSLELTNNGSVTAQPGAKLFVTATPDKNESLSAIGAPGWKCNKSSSSSISKTSPLKCTITLSSEVTSGSTLTLPLTLKGKSVGSSTWTVGVGGSAKESQQFVSTTRIDVVPNSPLVRANIIQESPLYDGGSGRIDIVVRNDGGQTANGAIAVIAIPRDADVTNIDSGSWSCLDFAFNGTNGTLTCATTDVITSASAARTISLQIAPRNNPKDLSFTVWASTENQYDKSSGNQPVTKKFEVAETLVVDAGQDLTVITPQTLSNGSVAPAVVVLTGSASMNAAKSLRWQQLCTQPNESGCGGTTSPQVAWLGVSPGNVPTTLTAKFTAPPITAPTDLFFKLTAYVGTEAITDSVTVRLIPPSGEPAATNSSQSAGNTEFSNVVGTAPTAPTTTIPTAISAQISNSQSVLQVPTLATAQLFGSGTGSGNLDFAWTQTSGPAAQISGASASQATLQFVAPLLSPDSEGETLEFQLTVTDSTGNSASATASVQVVWGDNGLQVNINNGASQIATTLNSPVSLTAGVSSRGTPYEYSWSSNDFSLSSASSTSSSILTFTTPSQATVGTVEVTVTDSFGRITTAQIEVISSALPPGELPQAFCNALGEIAADRPATLQGSGVTATITNATLNGPATPCAATTTASITSGTATLPGGITLSSMSGQLTIAGVVITNATVSVPATWNLSNVTITPAGLLLPFVSSTQLGVPTGSLTSPTTSAVNLPQWTGTTTIQFNPNQTTQAALTTQATGPTNGSSLTLNGVGQATSLNLSLSATGLVTIANVDLPVTGTVTANGNNSPVFATSATLATPVGIGASATLSAANLSWTPSQTSGSLGLSIGTPPNAFSMNAQAIVNGDTTSLAFTPTTSQWIPSLSATPLSFSGTGSISSNNLTLNAQSSIVPSLSITGDLTLQNLSSSINANCPLDGSQNCAPTIALSATAQSSLATSSTAVTGNYSPALSIVELGGTFSSISVAPLTVTDAQITIQLAPSQIPSASATGSTSILGNTRSATIAFAQQATVVTSDIGTQSISSTWQIPNAVAIATTAQFVYSPPTGPLAGEVSVPIPVNQLIGLGVTQIPDSFATGVLPSTITTALATFALDGSPAVVQLLAPVPNGWYLSGSATSSMSLSITSIGFTVTPSQSSPTISVTGTALLSSLPLSGTGSPSLQTFSISSGNITTANGSGVFSATLLPTGAMNSSFGINGLSASQITISVNVSSTSSAITLSGTTSVPAPLANIVGLPPTATPNLSASLTSGNPCVMIDLASGGGTGIDFGNYGFLVASSAFIVLAPSSCETSSGISVAQGINLLIDSQFLNLSNANSPSSVALAIDPTTFAIQDSIENVGITFGGFSLTNTSIGVTTQQGQVSISVQGTGTINGVQSQFSGNVVPPTQPFPALGTLTLTSSIPSLTLVDFVISDVTAEISGPSILNSATSQIVLSGTSEILGTQVDVEMTGDAANGEIQSFTQNIDEATYSLSTQSTGDTLKTQLKLAYVASPTPSMQITGSGGTFKTPSQEFTDVDVTIDGAMSTLSVTALVAYINDNDASRVSISGNYPLTGSSAGQYLFANATTIDGYLSGIPQKVTVQFSRDNTSAESGQQTSLMTFGVFDSNTEIQVQGSLSTTTSIREQTLATSPDPTVSFRGLNGTMNIKVADSSEGFPLPYSVQGTFTTDGSSCEMWSTDPVLTGNFYRNATITYFTLSGPAKPILPFGVDILTASASQPVVLSNEYLPGSTQSANAITLAIPLSSTIYSGWVSASFGVADCSYSIAGSVSIIITGGQAAQELASVLQPPSGLSVNVANLFGSNGELPPNIEEARQVYAYEAKQHQIQKRAADAQTARTTAQNAQEQAQQNSDNANEQRSNARAEIPPAEVNYRNALADLATAQAVADQESLFPFAGEELENAYNALNNADRQATTARQLLDRANANLSLRETEATTAAADLDRANTDLQQRQNEATNAENQQEASQSSKLLQLTLSLTYCATCEEQFTSSISGEFYFDVIYVAGVQLGFDYGDEGWTVQFGGDFGVEWQHSYGTSHLGVFLDASLIVTFSTEYSFSNGWEEVDFSLQATAQADVYLSTWLFTWTADLLSIDILGEVYIEPSVSVAGSYNIYVFGLDVNGQWGGNLNA